VATPRDLTRRVDARERYDQDELARTVREIVEQACRRSIFTDTPEIREMLFAEAMAEVDAVSAEWRRLRAAGTSDREMVKYFASRACMTVEEYEREMAAEIARGFG
jgi:hypothetical protein